MVGVTYGIVINVRRLRESRQPVTDSLPHTASDRNETSQTAEREHSYTISVEEEGVGARGQNPDDRATVLAQHGELPTLNHI